MSKVPKLHFPNLRAAMAVAVMLKEEKSLTEQGFRDAWYNGREFNDAEKRWTFLPQNFDSVKAYLIEKGLMTSNLINGFRFYVATQKLVRSKLTNCIPEYYDKLEKSFNKL